MASSEGQTELLTGWSCVVHQPSEDPEPSELPSTVDITAFSGGLSVEPNSAAQNDGDCTDSDSDSDSGSNNSGSEDGSGSCSATDSSDSDSSSSSSSSRSSSPEFSVTNSQPNGLRMTIATVRKSCGSPVNDKTPPTTSSSKPLQATTSSKPTQSTTSKPLQTTPSSKTLQSTTIKPVQTASSKPLQPTTSKPSVSTTTSKPSVSTTTSKPEKTTTPQKTCNLSSSSDTHDSDSDSESASTESMKDKPVKENSSSSGGNSSSKKLVKKKAVTKVVEKKSAGKKEQQLPSPVKGAGSVAAGTRKSRTKRKKMASLPLSRSSSSSSSDSDDSQAILASVFLQEIPQEDLAAILPDQQECDEFDAFGEPKKDSPATGDASGSDMELPQQAVNALIQRTTESSSESESHPPPNPGTLYANSLLQQFVQQTQMINTTQVVGGVKEEEGVTKRKRGRPKKVVKKGKNYCDPNVSPDSGIQNSPDHVSSPDCSPLPKKPPVRAGSKRDLKVEEASRRKIKSREESLNRSESVKSRNESLSRSTKLRDGKNESNNKARIKDESSISKIKTKDVKSETSCNKIKVKDETPINAKTKTKNEPVYNKTKTKDETTNNKPKAKDELSNYKRDIRSKDELKKADELSKRRKTKTASPATKQHALTSSSFDRILYGNADRVLYPPRRKVGRPPLKKGPGRPPKNRPASQSGETAAAQAAKKAQEERTKNKLERNKQKYLMLKNAKLMHSKHKHKKHKKCKFKILKPLSAAITQADPKLNVEIEKLVQDFVKLCTISPKENVPDILKALKKVTKKRKTSEHGERKKKKQNQTSTVNKEPSSNEQRLPLKKRHYHLTSETTKSDDDVKTTCDLKLSVAKDDVTHSINDYKMKVKIETKLKDDVTKMKLRDDDSAESLIRTKEVRGDDFRMKLRDDDTKQKTLKLREHDSKTSLKDDCKSKAITDDIRFSDVKMKLRGDENTKLYDSKTKLRSDGDSRINKTSLSLENDSKTNLRSDKMNLRPDNDARSNLKGDKTNLKQDNESRMNLRADKTNLKADRLNLNTDNDSRTNLRGDKTNLRRDNSPITNSLRSQSDYKINLRGDRQNLKADNDLRTNLRTDKMNLRTNNDSKTNLKGDNTKLTEVDYEVKINLRGNNNKTNLNDSETVLKESEMSLHDYRKNLRSENDCRVNLLTNLRSDADSRMNKKLLKINLKGDNASLTVERCNDSRTGDFKTNLRSDEDSRMNKKLMKTNLKGDNDKKCDNDSKMNNSKADSDDSTMSFNEFNFNNSQTSLKTITATNLRPENDSRMNIKGVNNPKRCLNNVSITSLKNDNVARVNEAERVNLNTENSVLITSLRLENRDVGLRQINDKTGISKINLLPENVFPFIVGDPKTKLKGVNNSQTSLKSVKDDSGMILRQENDHRMNLRPESNSKINSKMNLRAEINVNAENDNSLKGANNSRMNVKVINVDSKMSLRPENDSRVNAKGVNSPKQTFGMNLEGVNNSKMILKANNDNSRMNLGGEDDSKINLKGVKKSKMNLRLEKVDSRMNLRPENDCRINATKIVDNDCVNKNSGTSSGAEIEKRGKNSCKTNLKAVRGVNNSKVFLKADDDSVMHAGNVNLRQENDLKSELNFRRENEPVMSVRSESDSRTCDGDDLLSDGMNVSAENESRMNLRAENDSRMNLRAENSSRRNLRSDSNDSRTILKSESDSRINLKTAQNLKTASDSRMNLKTASDSRMKLKTASDSKINLKTESDSRMNLKTASDSRMNSKTASESRMNLKTASDSRVTTLRQENNFRKVLSEPENDSRINLRMDNDSRMNVEGVNDPKTNLKCDNNDFRMHSEPENDSRLNLRPENDSKKNLRPENDSKGNLKSENDSKRNLKPVNDSNWNLKSENDSKRNLQPENDSKGNLRPENDSKGNLKSENDSKKNLRPENDSKRNLRPDNDSKGNLKSENNYKRNLRPENDSKRNLRPENNSKRNLKAENDYKRNLRSENDSKPENNPWRNLKGDNYDYDLNDSKKLRLDGNSRMNLKLDKDSRMNLKDLPLDKNDSKKNLRSVNNSDDLRSDSNDSKMNVKGSKLNITVDSDDSSTNLSSENDSVMNLRQERDFILSRRNLKGDNDSKANLKGDNHSRTNLKGDNDSKLNLRGENDSRKNDYTINLKGDDNSEINLIAEKDSRKNLIAEKDSRKNLIAEKDSRKNLIAEKVCNKNLIAEKDSRRNLISTKNFIAAKDSGKNLISTKNFIAETDSTKNFIAEKDSGKTLIAEKDSTKNLMAEKDSRKNLLAEKNSTKNLIAEKDSRKNLLAEKDSTKNLIAEKDSRRNLVAEKDSGKNLIAEKDSKKNLIAEKDSTKNLIAEKDSRRNLVAEKDSGKNLIAEKNSRKNLMAEKNLRPENNSRKNLKSDNYNLRAENDSSMNLKGDNYDYDLQTNDSEINLQPENDSRMNLKDDNSDSKNNLTSDNDFRRSLKPENDLKGYNDLLQSVNSNLTDKDDAKLKMKKYKDPALHQNASYNNNNDEFKDDNPIEDEIEACINKFDIKIEETGNEIKSTTPKKRHRLEMIKEETLSAVENAKRHIAGMIITRKKNRLEDLATNLANLKRDQPMGIFTPTVDLDVHLTEDVKPLFVVKTANTKEVRKRVRKRRAINRTGFPTVKKKKKKIVPPPPEVIPMEVVECDRVPKDGEEYRTFVERTEFYNVSKWEVLSECDSLPQEERIDFDPLDVKTRDFSPDLRSSELDDLTLDMRLKKLKKTHKHKRKRETLERKCNENLKKRLRDVSPASSVEKSRFTDDRTSASGDELTRKTRKPRKPPYWRKKYLVAGLFSDYYKEEPSSLKPAKLTYVPEEHPYGLLPPPYHCGKYLRCRKSPFQLPYDLWWQHTHNLLQDNAVPSWNYRKIRTNVYNVKNTAGVCEPQACNCTAQAGCVDDCINRIVFSECPASHKCKNQKIQKHEWAPGIEKFMTEHKGWGVKTHLPIRHGEFILEYVGEVVSDQEFKERMATRYIHDTHHYCLHLDGGLVIDGHRMGGDGRFVNHSCEPNCEMQKWSVNGQFRMALFALRDIEGGEELTYDYNFSLFNAAEGQECKCGSDICRGVIGGKSQRVRQVIAQTPAAPPGRVGRPRKNQAKKATSVPVQPPIQVPQPQLKPISHAQRSFVLEHHCFLLRNLKKLRRSRDTNNTVNNGSQSTANFLNHLNALRQPRNMKTRRLAQADENPELKKTVQLANVMRDIYNAITEAKDEKLNEKLCTQFMMLPSKRKLPDYYTKITDPIDLTTIEQNIDGGIYKTVESFDADMSKFFANNFKFYGRTSDMGVALVRLRKIYNDVKKDNLQKFEDVLGVKPTRFMGGRKKSEEEDIIRCICGMYRDEGLMIQCERCLVWQHCECVQADENTPSYHCEKCVPREVDYEIAMDEFTEHGHQYYMTLLRGDLQLRQGDTVYVLRDIPIPGSDKKHTYDTIGEIKYTDLDIFRIERLWKDCKSGQRFAYGHHYLRPHETYHEPTRKFFPNEVMRVPLYEAVPVELIISHCWVMDLNTYCKGRPIGAPEEHIYICEYRVDKSARLFSKVSKSKFPVCSKSYAFERFDQRLKISRTYTPHDLDPAFVKQRGRKPQEAEQLESCRPVMPVIRIRTPAEQKTRLNNILLKMLNRLPTKQALDVSYLLEGGRRRKKER